MIQAAKRDFGTLRTARIVNAGLAEFEAAPSEAERAEALAGILLGAFDDYYTRSRRIPWLAKRAFETRDWPGAIELSQERIAIFSVSIDKLVPILKLAIGQGNPGGEGGNDGVNYGGGGFWDRVEARTRALVSQRYEADLALAYLASVRRRVHEDIWVPAAHRGAVGGAAPVGFLRRFEAPGRMTAELAEAILTVPGIEAPFRDLAGDAARVAQRINQELEIGAVRALTRVEVVEAGFYRNRGAYILGALEVAGETGARMGPLALALLHREAGVEVDAVILRETTLRHVFSSTLANFHVSVRAYHELVDYLHGLMPGRPHGMHYSTVGYNHVGKLAVMEQIAKGLGPRGGERLDHAPGPRGSVAMAFTSPATDYVLKVIRDTPTADYKWGHYAGVDSVLAKYDRVHEINRSGSMLDNIVYSNISLPRAMFAEAVLEEMLQAARESVSLHDGAGRRDSVFFRHLIVQRKLVPVPMYLEACTRREAEMVVIRLGQCIRNNAATNVFNKDLDGRNYGVSSLRFVYLFDYDAVETLSEVKVRTNLGREDGEEDIPDWFFEDGTIFLPEELEAHLRLPDRDLRRLFRQAHGELLTVDYWTRMQRHLSDGRVPRVRTYPRATQLRLEGAEGNLTLSEVR